MADKEPMWAEIRAKHGLKDYTIRDLTTWDAAISYLFSVEWDQMSAMTKAQKAGWTEVIRFIRATDPYGRMVTIHPSRSARETVADPLILDFDMHQTGHRNSGVRGC